MTTPAPGVRLVVADVSHASTVHALVREHAAHDGSLDEVTTSLERWRELLDDTRVVVVLAWSGGEPVAYAAAVRALHLRSGRDVVAIDALYVRPSMRGQGIGEALMWSMARHHPDHAIRWEIEEGDLTGQRFHLGLGARLRRKVVAWWDPRSR